MSTEPLKLIIHADDFGLTKGINDSLVETFNNSPLNSISVLVNGYALDHAKQRMTDCPGCRWTVHLNVVEGAPLAELASGGLLNSDGRFSNNFLTLGLRFMLSGKAGRKLLRKQVRDELEAQLDRAQSELGLKPPFNVDSHQHLHMLPFIFDVLMDLSEKYPLAYVRIPEDRFMPDFSSFQNATGWLSMNLLKFVVFKVLGRLHKKKLRALGIATSDVLVSILYTGRMNPSVIRKALAKIRKQADDKPVTAEVLFHPGLAAPGEEAFWEHEPYLKSYYFSGDRTMERSVLENDMPDILKGLPA